MTYFSPKKAIKPKFVREPGILSHSEVKLGKSAMNDKRLFYLQVILEDLYFKEN